MRRRCFAVLAVLVCVLALAGVPPVYADGAELPGNVELSRLVRYVMPGKGLTEPELSGKVEFLRREDDRYVMQVTVENAGADFSGAVRLVFAGNYVENACAYDTELTLPEGGQKQFTLTIPENAADITHGGCVMSFLDEKGRSLKLISLKNVFGGMKSGVGVGILSDHYDDLTYLDLGGMDFDIQNKSEPIRLVELNADNLDAYLDGLYFLVIDRFDVAGLGVEKIGRIQDWVRAGGWLLIGTGEYGEQTLGGFDEDFLGLYVAGADEDEFLSDMMMSGAFWSYQSTGIEFWNMAVADVEYRSAGNPGILFEQHWEQPCLLADIGDGAVGVFLISLGDPELKKGNHQLYSNMLDTVMIRSNSYGSFFNRSDMTYLGRSALARIDHENTNVDFTWLKILIGIYVILAGPVLYLILRGCKKSEWYWGAVPLLGVVFIVLVFFSGKGIRLTETKVYSVSVQKVDGSWQDSYYNAYHSGTKPWSLRLVDGYEVAGTGFSGTGYSYSNLTGAYHYLVRKDSWGLSVGMKPEENFESGYLYAGGRTESAGRFECQGLAMHRNSPGQELCGTVANRTGEDLAYLAVIAEDGAMAIFSDIKAGETLDLAEAFDTPGCIYFADSSQGKDYYSMYYDLNGSNGRRGVFRTPEEPPMDEMMALFIGLAVTADPTAGTTRPVPAKGTVGGQARIVALTEHAAATVASRCEEKAYRCLYAFAKMEVDEYAEN